MTDAQVRIEITRLDDVFDAMGRQVAASIREVAAAGFLAAEMIDTLQSYLDRGELLFKTDAAREAFTLIVESWRNTANRAIDDAAASSLRPAVPSSRPSTESLDVYA